jgi:hypothetical protein
VLDAQALAIGRLGRLVPGAARSQVLDIPRGKRSTEPLP